MRIRIYRDEAYSRHLELIGTKWSLDLVSTLAGTLLLAGFGAALWAQLVH